MEIRGNTIFFKTDPDIYEIEENGSKPRTVRVIRGKERALFLDNTVLVHLRQMN